MFEVTESQIVSRLLGIVLNGCNMLAKRGKEIHDRLEVASLGALSPPQVYQATLRDEWVRFLPYLPPNGVFIGLLMKHHCFRNSHFCGLHARSTPNFESIGFFFQKMIYLLFFFNFIEI